MHHRWNPYSDEIKKLPMSYWTLAFNFLRVHENHVWDNLWKPHAEFVGQISNPEAFGEYLKYKKKEKVLKEEGQMFEETPDGTSGAAIANAHYDPTKGLVDGTGRVIMPKEQYEQMIGLEGIAISG